MDTTIIPSKLEEYRFKTISEFKWSAKYGGEIVFVYKEKDYGIFRLEDDLLTLVEIWNDQNEIKYDDTNAVLEYILHDGVRLRDVITQVKVIDRML